MVRYLKKLHLTLNISAVFVLSFIAIVLLVKNETEVIAIDKVRTCGQVLTKRSFTIRVLTNWGGIKHPLITARAWCFLSENSTEGVEYVGVSTRFVGVGTTSLGSSVVNGLGCDWFQFGFPFYIFRDGTEDSFSMAWYEGRGRSLYPTQGKALAAFETDTPHDLDEISRAGFLFKLLNVTLFLYDGSELYWANSDITITHEFFREDASWNSTISINTTLPLKNSFDTATNTLTIHVNVMPAIIWVHATIPSTMLSVVPIIAFITWRKRKK
jgi:hypothetical protein